VVLEVLAEDLERGQPLLVADVDGRDLVEQVIDEPCRGLP
jgi:hypothetical protein